MQIVEEHLVGLVVDHGVDAPDGQALADRVLHIDQQHRQPLGAPLDLVDRRGAHQQQHQVGLVGARGPQLLAVDDVVVAVAHRARLELGGVGAGGRLGHAERLKADFAGRDLRQVAAASAPRCRAAAACPSCTSGRDRRRAAAGGVDFLEDHAAGAQRQARRRRIPPGSARRDSRRPRAR